MNVKHWTEEQMIAHLYGVGLEDEHVSHCSQCAQQLAAMQSSRLHLDAEGEPDTVSSDLLAAQRRKIYQKASAPAQGSLLRWFAPVLAALLVMIGGLWMQQQRQQQNDPSSMVKVSDTQLVEDAGRIAFDSEPAPVAPLQELFE